MPSTWIPSEARREIVFNILTKPKQTSVELFAFVHLLASKFDGAVTRLGRHKESDGKFGAVYVGFENYSMFADARSHCRMHLDETGTVTAAYRGALETADPSLRFAKDMRKQVRALKLETQAPYAKPRNR